MLFGDIFISIWYSIHMLAYVRPRWKQAGCTCRGQNPRDGFYLCSFYRLLIKHIGKFSRLFVACGLHVSNIIYCIHLYFYCSFQSTWKLVLKSPHLSLCIFQLPVTMVLCMWYCSLSCISCCLYALILFFSLLNIPRCRYSEVREYIWSMEGRRI
jgi:hypothetical protein